MIDAADRLYGLALEDFTAERDALAKTLRAEGRRDEAEAIKALRKPTVVVWAANQVMRTQRAAARRLVEAADRAAERPGDRAALEAHRHALDELMAAASGLLSGAGRALSEDAVMRVRSALHAGSLHRELREDFTAGRLTGEPSPAGFGALTAAPRPASKLKPAPKPKAKPAPKPKGPSPAARKRVTRAEKRVKAAREELEQALRALDDARSRLDDEG